MRVDERQCRESASATISLGAFIGSVADLVTRSDPVPHEDASVEEVELGPGTDTRSGPGPRTRDSPPGPRTPTRSAGMPASRCGRGGRPGRGRRTVGERAARHPAPPHRPSAAQPPAAATASCRPRWSSSARNGGRLRPHSRHRGPRRRLHRLGALPLRRPRPAADRRARLLPHPRRSTPGKPVAGHRPRHACRTSRRSHRLRTPAHPRRRPRMPPVERTGDPLHRIRRTHRRLHRTTPPHRPVRRAGACRRRTRDARDAVRCGNGRPIPCRPGPAHGW